MRIAVAWAGYSAYNLRCPRPACSRSKAATSAWRGKCQTQKSRREEFVGLGCSPQPGSCGLASERRKTFQESPNLIKILVGNLDES